MFFLFVTPEKIPLFTMQLDRLEQVLKLVRTVHPQMSTGALATLIGLARRQEALWTRELVLPDFADELGMAYTSLLRNLDLLSEGPAKAEGLKLIDKGMDPNNPKERRFRITSSGLSLLHEIEVLLGAEPADTGRTVLVYPTARTV